MKRFVVWPAVLLLAACGETEVRVPPLSIGGAGGARFMSGGKTPVEAYDAAYTEMTKLHLEIRQSLAMNPPGTYAVRESLKRIVENLEAMRALTPEKEHPMFDPLLRDYHKWHQAAAGGRFGGMRDALDVLERRVAFDLHATRVDIFAEFPPGFGRKDPDAPAPKDPVAPKDPGVPREPAPPTPVSPPREPDPTPPPPADSAVARVVGQWRDAHDALQKAWTSSPRGDSGAAWRRVALSLEALKSRLAEADRIELDVYVQFYKDLARRTSDFSKVPDGERDADVVKDLEVVRDTLERAYGGK